jgi:hypothetical protein
VRSDAGTETEGSDVIDPVCLAHGLPESEHLCIVCCLCFRVLTVEECAVVNGMRTDICVECAAAEQIAEVDEMDVVAESDKGDGLWMSTDCDQADGVDHFHENCEDPMDCSCPCHEGGGEEPGEVAP